MKQAESSSTHVRHILGPAHHPDPERPNNEGGATPLYFNSATGLMQPEKTSAYPLYMTFAVCRRNPPLYLGDMAVKFVGCGKEHHSLSTHPQYDDEGLRAKPCEECIAKLHAADAAKRRAEIEEARAKKKGRAPARRRAAPAERAGE